MQQPQFQILAYAALAMILGGLVGLDREAARKPAGLRTHMLVSGAAALLVLLGQVMVKNYDAKLASLLTSDPIRIIEAIITGVSFLGAGTIMRRESNQVEGLTTAASLLLAAAIGISVALSQWIVAVGLTLLVLLVLRFLGYLAGRFTEQPNEAR